MDTLQECAENFKKLADTISYVFHVSKNKKVDVFSLDFKESDFHHVAGLQYLTDIMIPGNKSKVMP